MVYKVGDYIMCNKELGLVIKHQKGQIHVLWTNGNINQWHSWQVKTNAHDRYWRRATSAEVLLYWNYPIPLITHRDTGVIFNGKYYFP